MRRSPELLSPEEIRPWLIYLREERKLAPASRSPTIDALRFLYRVTLKRDWSDEDFPLSRKTGRVSATVQPSGTRMQRMIEDVQAAYLHIRALCLRKPQAMAALSLLNEESEQSALK
ncbi:phage integrase N-terminal SAM-like domain-containing protein [Paraburkholderia mimosarum]|uniref:phage integrase N-terminal SAM-like domain-containing protein n=1 Tax=Paraburkholderia mimosarum TaxID=312026 RepID=UPI00047F9CA2|nr:phage integrase N-terminal SAM-like domain-containing protein [Paraburkholderia mimosarum]